MKAYIYKETKQCLFASKCTHGMHWNPTLRLTLEDAIDELDKLVNFHKKQVLHIQHRIEYLKDMILCMGGAV